MGVYSYRRYSALSENLSLNLGSLCISYILKESIKWYGNAVFAQQIKLFLGDLTHTGIGYT